MIDLELQAQGLDIDLNAETEGSIDLDTESTEPINLDLVGKDLAIDLTTDIANLLDIDLMINGCPATIVHINTTAYWAAHPELVGERGHIYVYTDHGIVDGQYIPAIKIGDGMSYLIDNPFVSAYQQQLIEHINNHGIHITPQERYFWNNKVRCDETTVDGENLMFTKN